MQQKLAFIFYLFNSTMHMPPKHYARLISFFYIYLVFSSFLLQSPSPWFNFLPNSKELCIYQLCILPHSFPSQPGVLEELPSLTALLCFLPNSLVPAVWFLPLLHPYLLKNEKGTPDQVNTSHLLRAFPAALGTAEHDLLGTVFPLF